VLRHQVSKGGGELIVNRKDKVGDKRRTNTKVYFEPNITSGGHEIYGAGGVGSHIDLDKKKGKVVEMGLSLMKKGKGAYKRRVIGAREKRGELE